MRLSCLGGISFRDSDGVEPVGGRLNRVWLHRVLEDFLGFGSFGWFLLRPWVVGFLSPAFIFPGCSILLESGWAFPSICWVVVFNIVFAKAVGTPDVVWAVAFFCGVHGAAVVVSYGALIAGCRIGQGVVTFIMWATAESASLRFFALV